MYGTFHRRFWRTYTAPYGIDQLYVSPDGKPLHIIRSLKDGSLIARDDIASHQ